MILNINENNENIISTYKKKYNGTTKLPITPFIQFLSEKISYFNKEQIVPELFFTLSYQLISQHKIAKINTKINSSNMSLKELIAISVVIEFPNFFSNRNNDIKNFMNALKKQLGTDLKKTTIYINNTLYDINNLITTTNVTPISDYTLADNFILYLISIFTTNLLFVDMNLIIKMCIVTCNFFINFIIFIINLLVIYKVQPKIVVFTNFKNTTSIFISATQKLVSYSFTCDLVISDHKNLELDETCGKLEFEFSIDFVKNTYQISKFVLDYNTNNCDPNYTATHSDNLKNHDFAYVVPLLLLSGGIAYSPYLLAAVGGKTKNTKTQKHKKYKNQKTQKNKTKPRNKPKPRNEKYKIKTYKNKSKK